MKPRINHETSHRLNSRFPEGVQPLLQVRNLTIAALVAAHTLWSSSAPAMMYRLYAEKWHLSHLTTTSIFAIYPIVVVLSLILTGDLSDHIGRKTTMLIALCASLVGALCMAVALNVEWLLAGRALMGVGVGLSAGPSTAAVLEYSGAGREKLAAAITTGAQAGGFAIGLLVGGFLTEYGPEPLRASLFVLAFFILVLIGVATTLPAERPTASSPWRPRTPIIPRAMRPQFVFGIFALVTAFMFGVLILSFGGQVEHDLIGSSNGAVNGLALSVFPITFGIVAIVAKSITARRTILGGALFTVMSMIALVTSTLSQNLAFNLLSTFLGGAGYSLLFVGGLEVVSATAPETHRGGVLSAAYLFGYVSMSSLAVALGGIATAYGLNVAIFAGAVVITVFAVPVAGVASFGKHR